MKRRAMFRTFHRRGPTPSVLVCGAALWAAKLAAGQYASPFAPPPAPPAVASGVASPGNPASVRGLSQAGSPSAASLAASPPTGAPPATTPASAAATPVPGGVGPTLLAGADIIARIDGEIVLASDLAWQVDLMIKSLGARLPEEHREEFRSIMLRRQLLGLIDTKLLFADFRRTAPADAWPKVEQQLATPFEEAEIPRLMKLLKAANRTELESALTQSGGNLKDIQRQFNEKTVAGEWMRQKLPKPRPISREAMLAYYQDRLKEYEFPAQVRWEELMIRFDRCGGDRDEAWRQVGELGNEAWRRAEASPGMTGAAFETLAKEKSHGFSAADGGQYDWTTLGALTCEGINGALASLQVGQLSDRIESDRGFHIVRVLERREAGRTPFTDAQGEIRKLLEDEQKQADVEKVVSQLRRRARVWTIFDGDLTGEQVDVAIRELQKK